VDGAKWHGLKENTHSVIVTDATRDTRSRPLRKRYSMNTGQVNLSVPNASISITPKPIFLKRLGLTMLLAFAILVLTVT